MRSGDKSRSELRRLTQRPLRPQSIFSTGILRDLCEFCVERDHRTTRALSIFHSLPRLRSKKFHTRGSVRGSRLPTFGT